jgi:hypothetical protein
MAKYFKFFPTTYYLKDADASSLDVLTNITSRFGFEQTLKENASAYYTYEIKDGDTPEIIAEKIYGSPERHWIVLLFNDIIDPQFDWPLDQRTIIRFIDEKYTANADTANGQSGLAWAQSNIKEYYKIDTRTHTSSGTVIEDRIQVDANTYANIATSTTIYTLEDGATISLTISKETKSHYTYEIEENDLKRDIKILKPEFAPAVVEEFRRVISNG